jgi:hypothetical protein
MWGRSPFQCSQQDFADNLKEQHSFSEQSREDRMSIHRENCSDIVMCLFYAETTLATLLAVI